MVTGSGSPVSADSSRTASSLVTSPSTGTTSPCRTSTWSPDRELVDRNLLDRFAEPPVRDAGRPLDQRVQLAPRASGGGLLERVSAGQHQADDGAGG